MIGLHHIQRLHPHTVKSRVRAIIVHSAFDKNTFENDLAVIKLTDSIKFNEFIQPICLPDAPLVVSNETPCYISGWGYTQEKGMSLHIP